MRYGEAVHKALFVKEHRDQIDNALLGLAGEVGEILDQFKKARYHPGGRLDVNALRLEISDVFFYLALLNELYFGDSMLEVAKDNIAKLKNRYPENYMDVDLEELTL